VVHEVLLLNLITLIGKLLNRVKVLSIFFHKAITRAYDLYLTVSIKGAQVLELSTLLCPELLSDLPTDETHQLGVIDA
jgi:hypothetical protein